MGDYHWGKLTYVAGCLCFVAGCVPWLCATLEAIVRIPHRGWQGLIQVFFVFLVASPFGFAAFFVLNFLLQVTSCFKLCTGRVSGWEVTARGPSKPAAADSKSSSRNLSEAAARKGTASDLESGGSDTLSSAGSHTSSKMTSSL